MGAHLRKHPRFIDEQIVEVEVESRDELRELWSVDISKGGMFLHADPPPPFGTRLVIRLLTPDGPLKLPAEVVHVVDAEMAKSFGQLPGVGVQFTRLDKDLAARIERYVDGVAARLTTDLTGDLGLEPIDLLLDDARRVMDAINASDLYGAIGVDPVAPAAAIVEQIDHLSRRFAHAPKDASPPKVARLEQVSRQLGKLVALFQNPLRRIHYDFQRGHVHADRRRQEGQDFAQLRTIWTDLFPDRAGEARDHLRRARALEAVRDFDACVHEIDRALELDPFNEAYAEARAAWLEQRSSRSTADEIPMEAPVEDLTGELRRLGSRILELDHFEVLGVGRDATADELTAALLCMSRKLETVGPRSPPDLRRLADLIRLRLDSAYKTLAHPATRRAYVAEQEPSVESIGEAAQIKYDLGLQHLRRSGFTVARKFFAAAVELQPLPEYKAQLAWAMLADASFDRAQALELAFPLLESAIAKSTSPGERARLGQYHYYMGRLLRERGDIDDAVAHFTRAVELNPKLSEASTEVRLIQLRKASTAKSFLDRLKRSK
jgi:tetratricopeptide (TPR) repeat protein